MGEDIAQSAPRQLSGDQQAVVRELADTLSVTGLVLMALAIVAILYAAVFIVSGARDPTLLVVTVLCAPLVVAGFGLRAAAEPLRRSAEASSGEVSLLVAAMRELQRVFALQRTGFAIALAVAFAGVVYQAMR